MSGIVPPHLKGLDFADRYKASKPEMLDPALNAQIKASSPEVQEYIVQLWEVLHYHSLREAKQRR